MFDVRDAVSGGVGSLCLVAFGAPFDTIKVIAQTSASTSPLVALRRVVALSGFRALWRGAGPALASALIENIVVFSALGSLHRIAKEIRGPDASPLSFSGHALLGAVAGIFSATAICPAEIIKCRLQSAAGGGGGGATGSGGGGGGVGTRLSAISLTFSLLKEGGLFRGLSPLLARDVPFNGIMFSVQDSVAVGLTKPLVAMGASGEGIRQALAGGCAGAVAWTLVYPLDVIKSRVQVNNDSPSSSSPSRSRSNGLATAFNAVRREGALFRGLSAAIMRAFVANGALFWGVHITQFAFATAK